MNNKATCKRKISIERGWFYCWRRIFSSVLLGLCCWQPAMAALSYQNASWLSVLPSWLPSDARQRINNERALLLAHRDYLENRLRAAQPLIRLIGQEVENRRLPPILILLPLLESGYRLDVVSPKGAVGLWQLMQPTAVRFTVPITRQYDGRLAFPVATRAALDYLTSLHELFHGDWLLAMAAYNCGENRVAAAEEQAHEVNYWALSLPEETRHYVPRLLALAELIQSPEHYGLHLPGWDLGGELVMRQYTGPVRLDELAKQGRWELSELTYLNPAARQLMLPIGMSYALLLPRDPSQHPVRSKPTYHPTHLGLDTGKVDTLLNLQVLADPLVIPHLPPMIKASAGLNLQTGGKITRDRQAILDADQHRLWPTSVASPLLPQVSGALVR